MSCAPPTGGRSTGSRTSRIWPPRALPSPSTRGVLMSSPSERVTADLLRSWGLPDPGESKKTRGRIIVVGGSRRTPGAVILAGEAALRVGAGRLALLVPASIEAQLGVIVPEAAVLALPEDSRDPIPPSIGEELAAADAV